MLPGIFDVIGPIMIGPSSSHMAGVVKIGKVLPEELKGTALGGLANTPTGRKIKEKIKEGEI